MDRLPALGSLRSIANAYDEDDISDEEELEKSAKKRKLSTEEMEKSEQKGEDSDYDIVVSDEEGNSSGAGSVKNAVVINQPKVSKASRLVSYGGDEDEDDDANKVKLSLPSKIPQDETEATAAADAPTQESEQAIQEKKAEPAKSAEIQLTSPAQETQNIEKENEDKKDFPDSESTECFKLELHSSQFDGARQLVEFMFKYFENTAVKKPASGSVETHEPNSGEDRLECKLKIHEGSPDSISKPAVFISYQPNVLEAAMKLKQALEANNLKCWIDIENTTAGGIRSKEIGEGIQGCKVVVAIVTTEYLKSDCHKEIALATGLNKTIVPVLFKEESLPLEEPMAVNFASLTAIKCNFGFTPEKLVEIVRTVAGHVNDN